MKQTNIVLSARATMTQMFLFGLVLVQRPQTIIYLTSYNFL